MYRLDSHIHCQYSPDSSTKIDDIIKKSIEDKIDIIAISDHNTVLKLQSKKQKILRICL
jgi:predicted metal-dependent phosphoesterase TrpH